MKKTTNLGFESTVWEGITFRASSDERVEIEVRGKRIYLTPLKKGIELRDHNTNEALELAYEPQE